MDRTRRRAVTTTTEGGSIPAVDGEPPADGIPWSSGLSSATYWSVFRIVGDIMGETDRTEHKLRPLDPADAATFPRLRRGAVAIVVTAFGALAVLPFVFATEDRPEVAVASSTVPDATLSTALEATPSTSSLPDSSTLSGVTSRAGVDLPRVGASFVRFEDVPLNRLWGDSVVWTGREIIVWGGQPEAGAEPNTGGAAFDPGTGKWRSIGAPPTGTRFGHTAVWTGDRMIVWGGFIQVDDEGSFRYRRVFADGAAYDPELDQWTAIPDAPIGQEQAPVALWTGSEMIILGAQIVLPGAHVFPGAQGSNEVTALSAAAFNPDTGSWRLLPDLPVTPVETTRLGSLSAVWTGEAVVASGAAIGVDTVAVYKPDVDEWETLSIPIGTRSGHTTVWTGTEVIIWGGSERNSERAVGYAINPETSQWRALPPPPVTERAGHGAAWTGSDVLMWGGSTVRAFTNSRERLSFGVLYNPQSDQWTVVDVSDAPASFFGLTGFEVVWLGDSALLWNQYPDQSGILTLDPVASPDSESD